MSNLWVGDPKDLKSTENGCFILGYFDGVHIAHKELINKALQTSEEKKLVPSVFTFNGPLYTKSIPTRGYLTTRKEKCELLFEMGIQRVFMVEFTDWLKNLSPEDFASEILIKRLNAKKVIVGPGFRFGVGGSGNPDILEKILSEHEIPVMIMPSQVFGDKPISSTRIRDCLLNSGDLESANRMLGRNYSLTGTVICGAGVGKTLGYPTANISILSKHKLIPVNGVYGCIVKVRGSKYISAVSIGNRPTFDDDHRSIEAHLLDYSDDCYNEEIEIEFVKMIRGQIKFENRDELIGQITTDTKKIRNESGEWI